MFDGLQLVRDAAVLVDGTTIGHVGAAPGGVEIHDLGDVTLLPGLVDAHQHLVFDGRGTLEEQVDGRSDDELRERARGSARRALAAGITTIRDLGDRNFVTADLRTEPGMPTILAAGPPLTTVDGHCWFLGGGCEDLGALRAAVDERRRRGCDVVKIMVSGGARTPCPMWASQFTIDEIATVVADAHAGGMPVAAHCHGNDSIRRAIEAGVDTIEHCTFLAEDGRSDPTDAILDQVAMSGIPISATFGRLPGQKAPPMIEANLQRIADNFRRLRDKGGMVVVGSDAGIAPGKLHDVLPRAASELAEIGLDGIEILTTLTADAARACGVCERKGRLAPGFDADILAVGGDAVADPGALLDVRGVWRAGRRVE